MKLENHACTPPWLKVSLWFKLEISPSCYIVLMSNTWIAYHRNWPFPVNLPATSRMPCTYHFWDGWHICADFFKCFKCSGIRIINRLRCPTHHDQHKYHYHHYHNHHGNHHDDHQNWTGMPSGGSAPPIAGFPTGESAALIQLGCYLLPMCISAANSLCCYSFQLCI